MINYKQKLYRLADIFDLQRQAGLGCSLEIFFSWTKYDESIVTWIKSILPNVDNEYIEFLKNYNGLAIGQWALLSTNWDLTIKEVFNAENMLREGTQSDINNSVIPIAIDASNTYYINYKNGIIQMNEEDFSIPARKIANSFEEFMNDCVFGERYLEFNGGNKEDEVYDYLKTFYKTDAELTSA